MSETETKPKPGLRTVTLPQAEIPMRNIVKNTFTVGPENSNVQGVLSYFVRLIGGNVINARGVGLMWERAVAEYLPNPQDQASAEKYFPNVARAIVPEDIALQAIKFRDEMLLDTGIINARRL